MTENQEEMKKFAKDRMKTEISNKKIRGMLTVASGDSIGIPLHMAPESITHVHTRMMLSFRSKEGYEHSTSPVYLI